MIRFYRLVFIPLFLVAMSGATGCVDSQDPGNNELSSDAGDADAGHLDTAFDADHDGGDGDTDIGADPDIGAEAGEDADSQLDAADADDVPDSSSPQIEPWDCAPNLELDDVRYANIESLDDVPFVEALQGMISEHQTQDYFDARQYMFHTVEVRDDNMLECVYTAQRVAPDGTNTPQDQFNTEHAWPQSRGASQEPQRSDLHHLFPANIEANSERANYEFGNVSCDTTSCPWHENGSSVGPSADDNRDPVFETRPERRGDIARAVLYFSLRYDEPISPEEEAVLRDWHCDDPPDDYERDRNSDIQSFQHNRNPFIDRPDFVDRIAQF